MLCLWNEFVKTVVATLEVYEGQFRRRVTWNTDGKATDFRLVAGTAGFGVWHS
jgi:hypothetical protein